MRAGITIINLTLSRVLAESVFDSIGSGRQVAVMSTVPQSLVLTVADYRDLGEGPPHYLLIEGPTTGSVRSLLNRSRG